MEENDDKFEFTEDETNRLWAMLQERMLPWAKAWKPWRRCKAVKEPNPTGYWGRCELEPHSEKIDHALERGMGVLRWSTKWTN